MADETIWVQKDELNNGLPYLVDLDSSFEKSVLDYNNLPLCFTYQKDELNDSLPYYDENFSNDNRFFYNVHKPYPYAMGWLQTDVLNNEMPIKTLDESINYVYELHKPYPYAMGWLQTDVLNNEMPIKTLDESINYVYELHKPYPYAFFFQSVNINNHLPYYDFFESKNERYFKIKKPYPYVFWYIRNDRFYTLPRKYGLIEDKGNTCLNLKNMTSIQLGTDVKIIPEKAFYNCESLTEITIPPSVMIIESKAFYNTKIKEVTINENATVFEDAFPKDCIINYY
jgi:hypothetical protein